RQHRMSRLYRYAMVHQGPRRGRRQAGARYGDIEGAAQGRFKRGRYRGAGVFSCHAAIQQHDRRIGADGRRAASRYVSHVLRHGRACPGLSRPSTSWPEPEKEDVDARDKPGHDDFTSTYRLPGSEITPFATSLFQMNSTTSAPMVAVMKPASWSGP